MKLPQPDNPADYVGLYVIDFGDQCSMGYTAEEVAVLLESQRYAHVKVYKIYRAQPDGTLDMTGVARERFSLESGIFFDCRDADSGRRDYQRLEQWARQQPPPCRTQLQMACRADGRLLIALIYPAEYEQEMGCWMRDSGFRGSGAADAGPSQVSRYYQSDNELLDRCQLWPLASLQTRDRAELWANVGRALQR